MKKEESSEKYVINHRYGYGGKNLKKELNKLELRNVNDLLVYIDGVIDNAFDAEYKDKTLRFYIDNSKCKIVIENT